ncbi:MAG TPA: hypothetical protein VME92_05470 [Acetobacteraceae bacterium]|nr:hypothetical protein [Acetobacteraceae bacterium]
MPERWKLLWLHFSGAKRPIFRIKADIFRSNAAKTARQCCIGLEIPAECGTRHFARPGGVWQATFDNYAYGR